MMKYFKKTMGLIIIVTLLTVGMQACNSDDSDEVIVPEEPAITIINDSRMDLLIHYNLDTEVEVEAVIHSGEAYDIESGVASVTIDGGYF